MTSYLHCSELPSFEHLLHATITTTNWKPQIPQAKGDPTPMANPKICGITAKSRCYYVLSGFTHTRTKILKAEFKHQHAEIQLKALTRTGTMLANRDFVPGLGNILCKPSRFCFVFRYAIKNINLLLIRMQV